MRSSASRNGFRKLLKERACHLLLVLGVAASLGAGDIPDDPDNAPVPPEKFIALFQLMRDGINQQFTFLSFTVWHNPPLTPRKLEQVAVSASRMDTLAQKIAVVDYGRTDTYKFTHAGEAWTDADQMILMAKANQMVAATRSLTNAARKGDEKGIQRYLGELSDSCQSCHARFRKDLAFK